MTSKTDDWTVKFLGTSKLAAELLDENGDTLFEGFVNAAEGIAAAHNAALASKSAARQEPCAVCGGDGKPVSGLECICNGTGLLHVAELECRKLIYDLERKIEKLESAARQDTERLDWLHENWRDAVTQEFWEKRGLDRNRPRDWHLREAIDAARCGLDEGEQKKDLGVTEPASDVTHVRQKELYSRIQHYLSVGGLFNPEMMEHDKVRTLLLDIRDFWHPEYVESKRDWNGVCECGHLHSEHGKIRSFNYSAGTCLVGLCRCKAFVLRAASDPKAADSVGRGNASGAPPLTPDPMQESVQELMGILEKSEPHKAEDAPKQKGAEERVVARILERRDVGRAKYSKTMERTDLNILQWMRHAQDEATDLAVYLERILSDITSVSEWSGPDIEGGASSPNPVSVQERSESDAKKDLEPCPRCAGGLTHYERHNNTHCWHCKEPFPLSSAATEEGKS